MQTRFLLLLMLPATASACTKGDRAQPGAGTATLAAAAVDTATMTRTPTGVYYKELVVGAGPVVAPGQMVAIHYIGTLLDGTQFDANGPDDTPLRFRLGAGEMIAGFDLGLAGMRVGGRRQVVIPPELGYGAQGYGPVPPNATLVFVIEVVSAT